MFPLKDLAREGLEWLQIIMTNVFIDETQLNRVNAFGWNKV